MLSAIMPLPFKDLNKADRFVLLLWQKKMVFLSHFQAFHATFNYGQKENKATQKYVCEIICTYVH